VPFDNLALLMRRINSPRREQMVVENSYHVLTVDYDCQMIFRKIWEFMQQQAQPESVLRRSDLVALETSHR
jgi:esterase/lipase